MVDSYWLQRVLCGIIPLRSPAEDSLTASVSGGDDDDDDNDDDDGTCS